MTSADSPARTGRADMDGPPRVRFRLPDAFTRIPSPAVGAEESAEWERYLDEMLPTLDDVPDLPREAIKEQYTAMRQVEALQGVVGAAVCSGEMDEQLTLAYLTVAFAPSRHDDPVIAAEGLYQAELDAAPDTAAALDSEEFEPQGEGVAGRFTSPGRLVLALDLPVGPAVTVLTRRVATAAPTEEYPDGLHVRTGMIQVFIPVPGRSYVAVLTLTTPTPEHFDDYARVMAGIASTVEFDAHEVGT